MKYIFIILAFITSNAFGQRWITEKSTGYYITDSTGALVTGTAVQVRAWAITHMDIEDTASYQVETVAPTSNSTLRIYMVDDYPTENIPYIPMAPTSRIQKLQNRIPVGSKRIYLIYDRTLDKIAAVTRTSITYLTLTP